MLKGVGAGLLRRADRLGVGEAALRAEEGGGVLVVIAAGGGV